MKNLNKLQVIFLAFIIIFTTKSIAGEIILPLKKPTVDKEIKAKIQSKNTIYPIKRPVELKNKNLSNLQNNNVEEKIAQKKIIPTYP